MRCPGGALRKASATAALASAEDTARPASRAGTRARAAATRAWPGENAVSGGGGTSWRSNREGVRVVSVTRAGSSSSVSRRGGDAARRRARPGAGQGGGRRPPSPTPWRRASLARAGGACEVRRHAPPLSACRRRVRVEARRKCAAFGPAAHSAFVDGGSSQGEGRGEREARRVSATPNERRAEARAGKAGTVAAPQERPVCGHRYPRPRTGAHERPLIVAPSLLRVRTPQFWGRSARSRPLELDASLVAMTGRPAHRPDEPFEHQYVRDRPRSPRTVGAPDSVQHLFCQLPSRRIPSCSPRPRGVAAETAASAPGSAAEVAAAARAFRGTPPPTGWSGA